MKCTFKPYTNQSGQDGWIFSKGLKRIKFTNLGATGWQYVMDTETNIRDGYIASLNFENACEAIKTIAENLFNKKLIFVFKHKKIDSKLNKKSIKDLDNQLEKTFMVINQFFNYAKQKTNTSQI